MLFNALIIDDDPAFKKLLEKRLSAFIEGMVVTSFDSLAQARSFLQEVKNLTFDLVIIDEHLPDGHGHDFVSEGWFQEMAVLAVSSDEAPELPGSFVQAGAMYFLQKRSISEPLFKPLVLGIIDRNRLQQELTEIRIKAKALEAVKTMTATLQHEINNPLGAVIGGAYVITRSENTTEEQREAARLVEQSGKRIRHVLEQICQTAELKPVTKARHTVYHVPGDKPWDEGESNG